MSRPGFIEAINYDYFKQEDMELHLKLLKPLNIYIDIMLSTNKNTRNYTEIPSNIERA